MEYLYYGLLGWAYACAAILIMPFIRIYTQDLTDVNYIRPEIGLLFVFSGLLYNAKTPQGMLVISAGLYKETKYQTLAQAIINIVVSVALAPSLGIAGVLLGSVVSNLYRTIDLVIFIPRVLTKLPVTMTVRRLVRMLILTAISILPPLQYLNIMDRTPNGTLAGSSGPFQRVFGACLYSFWEMLSWKGTRPGISCSGYGQFSPGGERPEHSAVWKTISFCFRVY